MSFPYTPEMELEQERENNKLISEMISESQMSTHPSWPVTHSDIKTSWGETEFNIIVYHPALQDLK